MSRVAAMADDAFTPLFQAEYDRRRRAPDLTDSVYLHLSDVLAALTEALADADGTWLDYGAGSSPYASLLRSGTLKRADFPTGVPVEFPLTPGSECPAPAGAFDGILSTQVLEHVDNPPLYLRDCHRMLKPDGRLVLTTHGIWEEHGCPRDYWRWTVDGLCKQLQAAGFEIERSAKLTTGPRGLLQLFIQQHHLFLYERRTVVGFLLHFLGRGVWRYRAAVNRFADRVFGGNRLTDDPRASIYLAVLVVARKAAGNAEVAR